MVSAIGNTCSDTGVELMDDRRSVSRRGFLSGLLTAGACTYIDGLGETRSVHSDRDAMSGAMAQTATSAASENWRDQGVLDLSKSPYARLRSVPVHAVSLQDGFWSRRRRTNVDDSIPTMRLALEEHGRMDT